MGGKVSKKNGSPAKPDKRNSKIGSAKTTPVTSATNTPVKSNSTATKQEATPPAKNGPPSNKPTATTDQTGSTNTEVNDNSIPKERADIGDELVQEMNKKVTKEDFDLVVVLGIGSFGKVMKVKSKVDGKFYAMKVLNKAHLIDRNQVAHTRDEKSILQKLQHPFIVKLRYAFQTKDKLYMIMDYVHGGELFYHLKNQGRFPEERVRFYAAEIASALFHLHAQNIVYRDLKPENLLLDTDGHIVITDFGLSKVVGQDERTQTFCGTPEYLAPEVLRNEGHGRKVDWWSLGTLIYEMMSGLPPFYSKNIHEMYQRILSSKLVFPGFFTPDAKSLLTGLLNRDPNERFGTEEVKAHPFFAKINWDQLERKEITPPWQPPNAMNIDAEVLSVEVSDSYNGGRPGLVIDDKDVDAFDGFTYVGGMNNTNAATNNTAPNAEENKVEEVIEVEVFEEFKHETPKVAEKKPEVDPVVEAKVETNQPEQLTTSHETSIKSDDSHAEESANSLGTPVNYVAVKVESNQPETNEVVVTTETHQSEESVGFNVTPNLSARVEILAEIPISPKSVTSEDDDDSEDSESSDEDSESVNQRDNSECESSSDDSGPRGPFIVRLPGQQ